MKLINRGFIVVACAVCICMQGVDIKSVLAILILICVASCGMYVNDADNMCIVFLGYVLISMYIKQALYGLPLIIYEELNVLKRLKILKKSDIQNKLKNLDYIKIFFKCILSLIALLVLIVTSVNFVFSYKSLNYNSILQQRYIIIIELMVSVVAVMFNYYSCKVIQLNTDINQIRDNSKELNMALKSKNMYLIEKQDIEVYNATLKERNRIAREIHDNVGHMLTRSLLQTVAVITVNKQENLTPVLVGIKDTLDSAMTSIRSSVHNLYDESIDLDNTISNILKEMDNYDIDYEYDITNDIPRNIKYCIISVIKEATANIVKHSNANKVNIVLREHTAFYQMLIKDNGQCVNSGDGTGIGLENIRSRVESLNGIINIDNKNGFKIFISIPKGEAS